VDVRQTLALVLAGGRGKRMDILCSRRPKPALPFAGNFRVDEQAVVRDSIVMPRVTIGYHSVVDRCILEDGVHVGRFCCIGFGARPAMGGRGISVLGGELVIPDHTAIGRDCKVSNGAEREPLKAGVIPAGTTLVS
jgi:glucose-1-phosphate adenylyltransferase